MRRLIIGIAVVAAAALGVAQPVAATSSRTSGTSRSLDSSDHTRHHARPHHARSDHAPESHGAEHKRSDNTCDAAAVSAQDSQYLQGAIQGDRFEIAGGQYAQQHGVDASTRALGTRLVADHSKSLTDAVALANQLGIPVPQTMSDEQRHELDQVEAHTGLHFDDLYAELEVTDHHKDIHDAEQETREGCNAQVIANAAQELPTLETHLALAEQTHETIEALPNHESDNTNSGGDGSWTGRNRDGSRHDSRSAGCASAGQSA